MFCGTCHGSGLYRINREVEVIQLGDLVDMTPARTAQSADQITMRFGMEWIDVFLWGNHERPLADRSEVFGGFERDEVVNHMVQMTDYKLAHAAHGYLITHAGLGEVMNQRPTGSLKRHDVERLAAWINRKDKTEDPMTMKWSGSYGGWPVRDAISMHRGGSDFHGGIIWRDSREALWDVPQIFGHTSHQLALQVTFPEEGLPSYCIDTSKHGSASAIWLPSQEVVTAKSEWTMFSGHSSLLSTTLAKDA